MGLGFRGLGFSLAVWVVLTLLYQIPGFRLEGPGFQHGCLCCEGI